MARSENFEGSSTFFRTKPLGIITCFRVSRMGEELNLLQLMELGK